MRIMDLGQANQFVGLQRQAPAGMAEAVACRGLDVGADARAVHRLKEKVAEVKLLEAGGLRALLREDELQLVAGGQHQRRVGLGVYANPVDAGRSRLGAVGFDGDLETAGVQRFDQGLVQLQEGFAPGADGIGSYPLPPLTPALSREGEGAGCAGCDGVPFSAILEGGAHTPLPLRERGRGEG